MNILKLALLGSLRIAFFGFVKVALCAYTLFLSDTAIAGAARGAFAQRAGGQFEDIPHVGCREVVALEQQGHVHGIIHCPTDPERGQADRGYIWRVRSISTVAMASLNSR